MARTTISVTLPNYNHGKYLPQNIESLQAQTYSDWELVFVDDGSTDDSWSIIDTYRRRDARIIAERSPENRGANAATRKCLELCSGELLYASSADDYLENRHFFETTVRLLKEHREASGVFGRSRVIDGNDSRQLWIMGSAPGRPGFVSPERATKAFLLGQLFVPGVSAIWKRALIQKIGGYDPELGPQSDYFVNHALPALQGVVFVPDVVSATRVFKSGYSSSRSDAEFFRYHALVERKFRALDLPYRIDPEWLKQWRNNVINGRLAVSRQRQFISVVRRQMDNIQPWEAGSLPERFIRCRSLLLDECTTLEKELRERAENARRIFDEVAGALSLKQDTASPLAGGHAPEPSSVIRKFARRLRRAYRELMRPDGQP